MPLPLAFGAGIGAAGQLLGGAIGSDAAKDAAQAQLRAAREAGNLNTANYLTQLGINEPLRAGGLAGYNQLLSTFGLPTQAYTPAVDTARQNLMGAQASNTRLGAKAILKLLKQGKSIDEISRLGILKTNPGVVKKLGKKGVSAEDISQLQAGPMFQQAAAPVAGAAGAAPAAAPAVPPSFIESPDYQFVRDEGNRDILGGFGAGGQGAFSGNALKALTEFNQGHASGEFDKFLDRRFRLAGFGSQATDRAQDAGSQFNYQGGNALMNRGDARASGIATQGNIWGNALSGAANAFGQYYGGRNPYDEYMQAGQRGWGR